MDWSDDEEFPASQLERAIVEAETAYAERHAGTSGGVTSGGGKEAAAGLLVPAAAAPPPPPALAAAPPPPLAALAAAPPSAVSGQPSGPARRRCLPSDLLGPSARAPAAAAAGPAAAEPAAPDENLPPAEFTGPLRYAFTACEVDALCQSLLDSGVSAVGFDIEWRVTYQAGVPPRPVALIQLCYRPPTEGVAAPPLHGTAAPAVPAGWQGQQQLRAQRAQQAQQQHQCLLLHIAHSGLTPHLRRLLCTQDILKVGVGAQGDAQKLHRDFGLEMGGVVCLSEYANARLVSTTATTSPSAAALAGGNSSAGEPAGAGANTPSAAAAPPAGNGQYPGAAAVAAAAGAPVLVAPQKWSLAALACHLMGLRLAKSQALRCSNWEVRPPLSQEQKLYAATDAWASLRCFEILSKLPPVGLLGATPAPASVAHQPASAAQLQVAAAAAAAAARAEAAADWVPACATLRHLQPAKLAVYQALVQQGLSVQQVASQRRIQEDSVQGYMAEAISAGLGYSWSCLGVPAEALQLVATVSGELLGRKMAWQPDASTRPCLQQEQQQCEGGQQQWAVGSKRPWPGSAEALPAGGARAGAAAGAAATGAAAAGAAAAAVQEPAGSALLAQQPPAACSAGGAPTAAAACQAAPRAGGGAGAGAAPEGPVDVLACLLAAGHKLRELKEQRFEGVSYGQLRLALAHLGRCNPGPWE